MPVKLDMAMLPGMLKRIAILLALTACGGTASSTSTGGTCSAAFAGVRWETTDFGLMRVTLTDGTVCDSFQESRRPDDVPPCPGCVVLECAGRGYGVSWDGGPQMTVLVVGKSLRVGPNIVALGTPACEARTAD